ncbi:MAG: crotonase/enoyl-CoA hydratase family protein [Rhizobiaceae bacterium]
MTTAGDDAFFLLNRDGAVAHLSMNLPARANAMTEAFWHELPALVSALSADPGVRALVISGEGRHFSGGMDLAAFQGIAALLTAEPGRAAYALRELIRRLQDAFTALERAPFPVIAAIHGACIGGAIDLITACDIRVAAADSRFAIEEIAIGMAADVGTLQRLPKLISPSVAAELAYSGRRFDAAEALSIGLVSQVLDDRAAMIATAMELAQGIAARSPLAIAGIKRNLAYSRDHSVADGLDYIATWNAAMLRPEDLMAAVQAKMTKSPAVFADLPVTD